MLVVEVCVESLADVVSACEAGADRIELCGDLSAGGVTPALEIVREAVETCRRKHVKVFCMLRCRGGDFVYSQDEKDLMLQDCKDLVDAGSDGIVTGALLSDCSIDYAFIRKVKEVFGELPVTFHKAFDDTKDDIVTLMHALRDVGVSRILTSGRKPTAVEGIDTLQRMIAVDQPVVVVAGSVRYHNIRYLLAATGAAEIHSRSREICAIKPIT